MRRTLATTALARRMRSRRLSCPNGKVTFGVRRFIAAFCQAAQGITRRGILLRRKSGDESPHSNKKGRDRSRPSHRRVNRVELCRLFLLADHPQMERVLEAVLAGHFLRLG